MGGQQCKEANSGFKCPSRCQQLNHSRSDLTVSLEQSSDAFQFKDDLSFDSQHSSQQQSTNEDTVDPYSDLKCLRFNVEKILQTCNRGRLVLKHTHDLILTRFLEEIECRQPLVALEIVIALSKLIQITGLLHTTWDYILEICDFIVRNFDMSIPVCENDMQIPGNPFPKQFHELLSDIERISDLNLLRVTEKCKLFNIIEMCWLHRPEESVSRLIEFRSVTIVPSNETWIRQLCVLLDKYFVAEKRTSVRIKCLFVLSTVLTRNVAATRPREILNHLPTFEETLVDNVVLLYMRDIDQDSDEDVRVFAVQILIEITLYCWNPRRSSAVLDLVKKVLDRSLHSKNSMSSESDEENVADEEALNDITTAIDGLVKIFNKKLFVSPSSSAAISYKLLINHLTAHYELGLNSDIRSIIRKKILELLLSLRANALQQIGVICNPIDASVKFSTQVKCSQNDCDTSFNESNSGSHQTSGNATPLNTSLTDSASPVTLLSFSRLFKCLTLALKVEKDWTIFKFILENLPQTLQNKAALDKNSVEAPQIVKSLCEQCISLINDRSKNFNTFYKGIPSSLTKSEFHGLVYPSLVSLIAYNDQMETPLKKKLVMCFEYGFTSQTHICIHALMLCASEMQDIMFKHMADVVLSLSKISATVNLSIPILEFLSHLTLRPTLYSNFTQDQFMSIFAIVLPYTNPSRFNDYTVTMAHKVIAMWFLQCRPPLRRHLVEYIIKGLQWNVMQPLEDNAKEDDRKRSSSLNMNDKRSIDTNRVPGTPRIPNSPNPINVDLPSSPSANQQQSNASVFSFNSVDNQHHHLMAIANANKQRTRHQINETFHTELIESCMDFLSKYTFSNCSAVPPKHSITDFILDRKQSNSWLVGQKVITITTSGCNQRASYDGLCEECNRLCKSVDHIVGASTNDEVAHYMDSGHQNQPQLFRSESDSQANNLSVSDKGSPIGRKRHQSEYLQSTQINKPASTSFDDSTVRTNSVSSTSLFRDNYCSCWCQGWAEVLIRTPSGNTSWIQRIQNRLNVPSRSTDTSLPDLTMAVSQREMYKEQKPNIENSREMRKSWNLDLRSFSTPPSVPSAFKRSSSSPEMEKSDTFDSIGDKEHESLNESPENSKRSDFDSPFEEANTTHGDPPAIVSYVRSPSLGSVSPAKPSVNKTVERKHSFSKTLKLDLTPNSNSLDSSQSISPLKPSSPNISCKTPQKASSKLDNIPELGHSGHRERVHTISVMSPASKANSIRKPHICQRSNAIYARSSGLSPAFVFLQFFYNTSLNASDRPILLPNDEFIQKSFRVLDLILPYETHKIGVVNIATGQIDDPIAILSNQSGSVRYTSFLKGLAKLINLSTVKVDEVYLGGLATDGSDGQFAYYWEDNLTQVIFHVATLMPNKKSDPHCNAKKAHVGNDFVVIVYNDSCENFSLNTLKGRGQFTYVCIVITPRDYQTNLVTVQTIPELADLIGFRYPVMLSDASLSQFVRQISIQANLASHVYRWRIDNPQSPYASNLVERLRKIKGLRQKALNFMNSNDVCSSNPPFKSTHSEFAADNDRHSTNHTSHHVFPSDFTNYV